MSEASNRVRGARPAAGARRAAVLALVLAAACGGERRAESGAADTAAATAPVTPPETVAAIAPDTSTQQPGITDTSTTVPAPGSSVARRSPGDTGGNAQAAGTTRAAPSRPAPAPAPAPAKPAAQPRDTQPRDTQRSAAAPSRSAQQAAAPAQDTTGARAAAPAQDTTGAQAAAPADTAAPETTGGQTATGQTTGGQTGATPPAQQDAPLRDEYHQAPRDTVVQAVYDGWKQYNLNCARCHGEDVLGSTIAPHLVTSLKPDGPINTKESFVQVVCAGRPEKGMPAWCPLGMEMEKIEQIYSYVKGRSAGEIGPGRPALREEG